MTKKDYKAIAEVIDKGSAYEHATGAWYIDREWLVLALTPILGADNARFDAERFRAACYGEPFKK